MSEKSILDILAPHLIGEVSPDTIQTLAAELKAAQKEAVSAAARQATAEAQVGTLDALETLLQRVLDEFNARPGAQEPGDRVWWKGFKGAIRRIGELHHVARYDLKYGQFDHISETLKLKP